MSGFEDEYAASQDSNFTLLQQRHQLLEEDFFRLYKKYGGDTLKEKIVDLYSEEFSEEEIGDIIKFWTSDIGKKIGSRQFMDKQKILGGSWAVELERCFLTESKKKESL